MELPLPLAGGCQCHAVRYEIRAQPLTLYACHCTECQRQSTGAFSLSMVAPREAVIVVSGKPRMWLRRHQSGRLIDCLFCSECGGRLFHNPHQNPKVTIVKAGTLDDARRLAPVGHIWTASAQGWVSLPEETVRYEGQPPDLSLLIEAWKAQQAGQAST
jgi:hypothetical protein